MERSILHCDMNAFYASVELLYAPQLRGRPMAVCGSVEARHGIVLAKSEEAKRCGVKTGEAIWQAKEKCPELVTVEPHFDRYVSFSRIASSISPRRMISPCPWTMFSSPRALIFE